LARAAISGSARTPNTPSPAAASVAREFRPGGHWFSTKAKILQPELQQRLNGREGRGQIDPRRTGGYEAPGGGSHREVGGGAIDSRRIEDCEGEAATLKRVEDL
jgi:hypothetical protein